MTKTTKKVKKISISEIEALASAYREKWLRMSQIQTELKALRSKISEYGDNYFMQNPSEKMSIRLGGCIITHSLVSVVQLPDDMQKANDSRFIKFCKAYPNAVKFEIRKSHLANIPISDWGIGIAEGRKVEIEVAERGEVNNG